MLNRSVALYCAGLVLMLPGATAVAATPVEGELDDWAVWHFATDTVGKGCLPPEKPCTEASVAAEAVIGPYPARARIPVRGTVTFSGGELSALELAQTRPVALPMATALGEGGNIYLAGLRWQLRDGQLRQTGRARASCDNDAGPGCRAIAQSIGNPDRFDSALDFDGIPANYPIQLGALFLDYHPAMSLDAAPSETVMISVASNSPAAEGMSPLFNAAGLAHFTLRISE